MRDTAARTPSARLRTAGRTLAAAALFLAAVTGCGQKAVTQSTRQNVKAAVDPWPELVATFRSDLDPQASRNALTELNGGLAMNPEAERPRQPNAGEIEAVKAALRLTDEEAKYLTVGEYTPLDGHHVAECLYFRDVAAALQLSPDDPAAVRAAAAFDWVCRHVVRRTWVVQLNDGTQQVQPPVPPSYVLRKGAGRGLERAYALLALCRQLDLDACLIGTDAADKGWTYSPSSDKTALPEGPFWAVGVRDGNDLLLFDPWQGEPFPGRTPNRPGTLAEVRANPGLLAGWRKAEQNKWPVTDEQIQGAGAYVSVPLPAVAPRMATLDDRVRAEAGARLWVDWQPLTDRLTKAAGGVPVAGWNPPDDMFTPVRGMGYFLPVDQGGADPSPIGESLFGRFQFSLLPADQLVATPPDLVSPDLTNRLRGLAVNAFGSAFQPQVADQTKVTWSPREKIQRGRFVEATRDLMKLRDQYKQAADSRAYANDAKAKAAVAAWTKQANDLYEQLSRAKVSDERAVQVPFAQKQIDEFWARTQPDVGLLLVDMLARPGAAEATYLLALSFHERAERSQREVNRVVRTDSTDPSAVEAARRQARTDWESSSGWWGRYEEFRQSQESSFPGRSEHAQKLMTRAEKMKAGG